LRPSTLLPSPVELEARGRGVHEQLHVIESHPELVIPGRFPSPKTGSIDPRTCVDAELHYLQVTRERMAGIVHAKDVRIAEGLRDMELSVAADSHPGLLRPPEPTEGPARQGLRVHATVRGVEGGISIFEQTVDGFLAGLPYEKRLYRALQAVNVNPLGGHVADLGLQPGSLG